LSPVVAILTLRSSGNADLQETMKVFRSCLARIRRRVVLSRVRSAVGFVEPKRSRDSRKGWTGWSVHVHLVLDVHLDDLDVGEVGRAWAEITRAETSRECGRARAGQFKLHARPKLESAREQSDYAAKSRDWCPDPGEMDSEELETLIAGVKGKRRMLRWRRRAEAQSVEVGEIDVFGGAAELRRAAGTRAEKSRGATSNPRAMGSRHAIRVERQLRAHGPMSRAALARRLDRSMRPGLEVTLNFLLFMDDVERRRTRRGSRWAWIG